MRTYKTQSNARHRRAAFTLVEATMSVLIVSGVLVASLGTLGAIGKARLAQTNRGAAVHLSEQVLAEVMQCYFEEPDTIGGTLGPGVDETARAAFDDVDDYDAFTMNPPIRRDGTAMPEYAGWQVKVKVVYATINDPRSESAVPTGLKQIVVSVSTPGGAAVEVYGLRCKQGAYEQLPVSTTKYLTWAGVSAKVGAGGKTIHGGAHPLNVTTSQ